MYTPIARVGAPSSERKWLARLREPGRWGLRAGVLLPTICAAYLVGCSVGEKPRSLNKSGNPAASNADNEPQRFENLTAGSNSLGLEPLATPTPSPQVAAAASNVPSNFVLIHQPETIALGDNYRGRGTSVAIIDDGINYSLADFGSCTGPGTPAGCRVAVSLDFSDGKAGVPSTGRTGDHGTNVSGVVATLAPLTQLLDLKVYAPQTGTRLDYVANAVNWVIANKAKYNIAAMNIAVDGWEYKAICDDQGDVITSLANALKSAKSAGILATIGSGKPGQSDAISVPACISAAVSVGAVDNSDVVQSTSNSASFLTMLAPGKDIPGAGLIGNETTLAAAHVAGAVAILRGLFPNDSSDAILKRMLDQGVQVLDPRNNLRKPRLDLLAAVQGQQSACQIQLSQNTASVPKEGGTGGLTVSTGPQCTWTVNKDANTASFVTTNVAKGTGTQFIEVTVAANTSNPRRGTLTFQVDGTSVSAQLTIVQSGAGIPVSPCLGISVEPTTGNVPASGGTYDILVKIGNDTCQWSIVYPDYVSSYLSVSPRSGKGTFVVKATLAANPSESPRSVSFNAIFTNPGPSDSPTSATFTFQQAGKDTKPPTNGQLTINGGASWTNSRTVSVSYSADDPSGLSRVCLSTSATSCTNWQPYGAPISITLTPNSQNVMTVYGWFEDRAGNRTTSAVSKTIGYDTTAPTTPTLSTTKTSTSITIKWTASTDRQSGVANYKLEGVNGSTPPAVGCPKGTVFPASSRGASWPGLTPNTTYSLRLCVFDGAGNSSTRTVTVTTNR